MHLVPTAIIIIYYSLFSFETITPKKIARRGKKDKPDTAYKACNGNYNLVKYMHNKCMNAGTNIDSINLTGANYSIV